MLQIVPSIFAADFMRLGEEVRRVEQAGARMIHVDIMDGHFVPNFTMGTPITESLRRATPLKLDHHLMIEDPDTYAPIFIKAGADSVSVHYEVCRNLDRTLHMIQEHGARAGVVINPATSTRLLENVLDIVDYVLVMSVNPGYGGQQFIPNALNKVRQLCRMRSERRLNFSQAFNPLGAISGVLIGTAFIFSGIELTPRQTAAMRTSGTLEAYLRHETMRVITPYLVLGAIVFVWALLIIRTRFPKVTGETASHSAAEHGRFRDLLRFPHFLLAVLGQFFYVGAQVGTWSYFIQYVQDYTHQPEKVAGYFLSGTLVAFGVGRFSSTWIMQYIRPNVLMGLYSIINVALVSVGILLPGWIGLWSIFLTSFFMSLMFPTIFALGLKGLGPNTKIGGSLIVMAIAGGAVFTPVMGLVAERTRSMALAMIVPLICYVFIAYYGFLGSRLRPGVPGVTTA